MVDVDQESAAELNVEQKYFTVKKARILQNPKIKKRIIQNQTFFQKKRLTYYKQACQIS